jgi:hypothetical protein
MKIHNIDSFKINGEYIILSEINNSSFVFKKEDVIDLEMVDFEESNFLTVKPHKVRWTWVPLLIVLCLGYFILFQIIPLNVLGGILKFFILMLSPISYFLLLGVFSHLNGFFSEERNPKFKGKVLRIIDNKKENHYFNFASSGYNIYNFVKFSNNDYTRALGFNSYGFDNLLEVIKFFDYYVSEVNSINLIEIKPKVDSDEALPFNLNIQLVSMTNDYGLNIKSVINFLFNCLLLALFFNGPWQDFNLPTLLIFLIFTPILIQFIYLIRGLILRINNKTLFRDLGWYWGQSYNLNLSFYNDQIAAIRFYYKGKHYDNDVFKNSSRKITYTDGYFSFKIEAPEWDEDLKETWMAIFKEKGKPNNDNLIYDFNQNHLKILGIKERNINPKWEDIKSVLNKVK